MPKLTLLQLETHLWSAADILRNRTAGQDYKAYILSLMFFMRLDCRLSVRNHIRSVAHSTDFGRVRSTRGGRATVAIRG